MEPQWTKSIPSTSVCNFFYFFFVVYAVLFALSILVMVGVLSTFKLKGATGLALGAQALLTTALGGTMMLFYYLICDRALLSGAVQTVTSESFMSKDEKKMMH